MGNGERSFLIGHNAEYLERLYTSWRDDPSRVPEEWRRFFEAEERGEPGPGGPSFRPASIFRGSAAVPALPGGWTEGVARGDAYWEKQQGVLRLVQFYRDHGHACADLDPLGQDAKTHCVEPLLSDYGLTAEDLDTPFRVPGFAGDRPLPLSEIRARLRQIYSGTIGLETVYLADPDQRAWLWERIESLEDRPHPPEVLRTAAFEIVRAERFERFLHNRFRGTKRFSLEGCEVLIPALNLLIEAAPGLGITTLIFGMAHRGRISVLAHVFRKSLEMIFSEFEDVINPELSHGSGDVKYHLGFNTHHVTRTGHEVYLALTPNPSHLEAVDPVVQGRVRARQDREDVGSRGRIVPVLIHGDAAIAGQGIAAETFNLAKLTGYRTGGTIHFVVNNQLGFTTAPRFARSTQYPTDVARMIEAPVFHVNADDVEAVLHCVQIALAYRQRFRSDVLIDIVCFRRYGHSETDEPSFTQPLMYRAIARHPGVRTLFTRRLAGRGLLSQEEVDEAIAAYERELNGALDAAHTGAVKWNDIPSLSGPWSGLRAGTMDDVEVPVPTGVPRELLEKVARGVTTLPPWFHPHKKVARLLEERLQMGLGRMPVDWGMAEHLAFGTLLWENVPVRLSGQDSRRGTFSHRHAVLTDQETGREYIPLSYLRPGQAPFYVWDSSLAEASILGFEFGYSLDSPHALILWEAQFGDFANGAQVIIDQFIASSETKWRRMSGLVLLLPHGYEGQGPEHSSARPHRYLSLAAEYNMDIANATTPAQYFHLLRRQMKRPFRKPLILFTPKSLLRHRLAVSSIEELATGHFREVLPDPAAPAPGDVRRLVLCSGKLYYELVEAREKAGLRGIHIARIEQLYPFPRRQVQALLAAHTHAELVWAQEEPYNGGAWPMFLLNADEYFGEHRRRLTCVSRPESAAPAFGYVHKHAEQQAQVVRDALGSDV